MNANIQAPADARYWERVQLARQMTGEARMLEGVRMFERVCEAQRLESMQANPTFTVAEAQAVVRRRLCKSRIQEEAELRPFMTTVIPK